MRKVPQPRDARERRAPARLDQHHAPGGTLDHQAEVASERYHEAKGVTFEVYDMPGVQWDGDIASLEGRTVRGIPSHSKQRRRT